MGLFNMGASFSRPGPGIPKDAPQKTGARLFFEILGREFWSLWALHFIYLLACLPIITIGPATAALCRVTVTMIRDENVYVWRDFWDAFRKNIKQGLLFGIPATLFLIAAVLLNLNAILLDPRQMSNLFFMAFIFLWTFLGVAMGCYIFPMVAYIDLPWFPLLKNALLLMVLGKLRTVVPVLLTVAGYAAIVAFFPLSPPIVLFVGYFSFLSFVTSFFVWPVIAKYVLRENQEDTLELPELEDKTVDTAE